MPSTKVKKSAIILDGKELADKMRLSIRKEIIELPSPPGLAAALIGDDEASKIYIRLKEKACAQVGVEFHKYLCNKDCYKDISEAELIEMIKFLNNDPSINGILVQLPLPKKYNADKITKTIAKAKDADGFIADNPNIIPPTIAAIIELLKATGEQLTDKKTVIIGKSDIFTKGLKKYLAQKLQIKDVKEIKKADEQTKNFDIIIIALGQAGVLKKNQVKAGAIVIDVGINKVKDKTVGDVDPKVAEVAGWLSPVPGGVGPLTVACLLRNVLTLAKRK